MVSGKKTKAAGQQVVKDGSGPASSAQEAPAAVTDGARHEPAVTLPGHYIPVGAQPVSPVAVESVSERVLAAPANISHQLFPQTDDVVALEVRAVTDKGFWRCGRFWSREPVTVFVSDDPDADKAANAAHWGFTADVFIRHADAARLKAEPMLIVTAVETVTESA